MRSFYSFWSKPYQNFSGNWIISLSHLCSWVISFYQSKKIFSSVDLYTDNDSMFLFKDILKLPFDNIHIINFPNYYQFKCLAKILPYRLQERPFVYLDSDFILYKSFNYDKLIIEKEEDVNNFYDYHNIFEKPFSVLKNDMNLKNGLVSSIMYSHNNLDIINSYCEQSLDIIKKYNWDNLPKYNYNSLIDRCLFYNFISNGKIDFSSLNSGYVHFRFDKRKISCCKKIILYTKSNYFENYNRIYDWFINSNAFAVE